MDWLEELKDRMSSGPWKADGLMIVSGVERRLPMPKEAVDVGLAVLFPPGLHLATAWEPDRSDVRIMAAAWTLIPLLEAAKLHYIAASDAPDMTDLSMEEYSERIERARGQIEEAIAQTEKALRGEEE